MSRANRSAYVAHIGLAVAARETARAQREAVATWPRAQSVRLLHVAKRRRERQRERYARAAVVLILAAMPAALFYFGSL
jgi:hypothetical protein